jgi:hypothetical protein
VSYAYNYTRYWSDETAAAYTNGALYYPTAYGNESYYDDHAFDTYRLPDPYTEDFIANPDPDLIQGGSFADYDNYYVTAQGLSGSMRPYAFQQALVARTRRQSDGNALVKSRALTFTNQRLSFRFANDFSNQYRQTPGATWNGTNYPFDGSPVYGNRDGTYGYDVTANRLIGSKHIDWFTNLEISNGTAAAKGFVDTSSPGFSRLATVQSNDSKMQIGGFMITNESGVTYHYALPVYSFNEHVYTEIVNKQKDGDTWNHLRKPGKYAYTWYLTGVTGPDYVDRGSPGFDASDWGYWVNFSYGKWADAYSWRNPSEGFHQDLDASYQSCSLGQKELYYLNSITTRTHTALFEKGFRADGKGAAPLEADSQKEHWKDTYDESYYKAITNTYSSNQTDHVDLFFPTLQLRLNRILLFNNKDLPAQSSSIYNAGSDYNLNNTPASGPTQSVAIYGLAHHGEYVIDKSDIDALGTDLLAKAIRVISLQHDYKLCPGTTNSYGYEQNFYDATSLTGKLTLNAINFGGLGGASLLPPTRFYYDLPVTSAEQVRTSVPDNFVGTVDLSPNSKFKSGDILKLTAGNNTVYYATLLNQVSGAGSNTYTLRYLKSAPSSGTYQAVVTKNPPYLKDNTDKWGLFKSDFEVEFTGTAETGIARQTTELSSKSLDVWSLRRIATPLGSTVLVNYEADEYQKPVLYQPSVLSVVYGGPISDDEANNHIGHLKLDEYTYAQASLLFKPNQILNLNAVTGFTGFILNGDISRLSPSNFAYKQGINLKVLAVEEEGNDTYYYGSGHNLFGSGTYLKVQTVSNDVFRLQDDGKNHDVPYGIFTGYISSIEKTGDKTLYGGGIRVASVTVANAQIQHRTTYAYNQSGTTSFEPLSYYNIGNQQYNYLDKGGKEQVAKLYRKTYLDNLSKLLVIAREVVPPGVMYERVTVAESVADGTTTFSNQGSVAYQFAVFDQSMVGLVGSPYQNNPNNFPPGNNSVEFRTRQLAIKDLTSRLGNLKRVTHYDAQGRVLTETVNHYASDGIELVANTLYDSPEPNGYIAQTANRYEQQLAPYNYQGLIKESFGDYREVRRLDGRYDVKGNISQRETYPNIQLGATTTDYRTGLQTTTQTLGFDFYSGAATSTLATDGYGNRWLTQTVPAYRQYPAMGPTGSPAANGGAPNRNMLSQTAATYVYKADALNNPVSLRAASVQTWRDTHAVLDTDPNQPFTNGTQPGVWRPWANYAWMPTTSTADGLTPLNNFNPFPFGSGAAAAPWQKMSEITRYNTFSNALEARDVNGQYLATKMGFNQSRVLVTGGPARYTELAYTGAEELLPNDYFGEDLRIYWDDPNGAEIYTTGGPALGKVHTGTHSVRIHSGKNGPAFRTAITKLNPSKGYRASVWATSPEAGLYYCVDGDPSQTITVNGKATQQANGWYLLTLDIPPLPGARTDLRVGVWNGTGQDVYVDDFRFQPVNAVSTAYVYDQQTGQVTDILDNTNLFTHYEYDAAGRLQRVRHETFDTPATSPSQMATQYSYHYALQPLPLDVPDLQIIAVPIPNSPHTVQFSVQATGLTAADYTISYRTGVSPTSGFTNLTGTSSFTYTYPAAGTYWATVRLTDTAGGRVREFAVQAIAQ